VHPSTAVPLAPHRSNRLLVHTRWLGRYLPSVPLRAYRIKEGGDLSTSYPPFALLGPRPALQTLTVIIDPSLLSQTMPVARYTHPIFSSLDPIRSTDFFYF
jgi:hypothetical protein